MPVPWAELGAESGNVRNMIVGQGMFLALTGVVVGIAVAFGLSRLIASFLFGVKAWDPAVFVTVPLLLTAVRRFAAGPAAPRSSIRWMRCGTSSRGLNPIDSVP